jgi:tetraacyldisaccharide 4'-kinase
MGGRGKTPLVAYLAGRLVAAGERPAILSRGYGRRFVEDGVVVVSDGERVLADLDRSGDEPLLLARRVPGAAVLVCEQRAIAGALARRVLGATVLLLDDGFQHRAMRRDTDIVIVAPEDLGGRRVPFGRLRESVSALRRADAIVVEGDASRVDLSAWSCPHFTLARTLGTPWAIEPDCAPLLSTGDPVISVTGIARPERFATALEAAGWSVAREISFGDHHRFAVSDLRRIAAAALESGARAVLTTEKDAMRLLQLRPLPVPIWAVPLDVRPEPAPVFDAWLLGRVAEARR